MPPDSDGGCAEESFVVATRLRNIVPNAQHLDAIEGAVQRVHRIVVDATELVSLHIVRCLEELPHAGTPNALESIPDITQDFYKMAMMRSPSATESASGRMHGSLRHGSSAFRSCNQRRAKGSTSS